MSTTTELEQRSPWALARSSQTPARGRPDRARRTVVLVMLFSLVTACAKPTAAPATATVTAPVGATSAPAAASHCPDGRSSLLLRDDAEHCVWTCDPEDDAPCPHEFACVGIGRTTDDKLGRYCETLKGPGVADGVTYPEDWRPKTAPK